MVILTQPGLKPTNVACDRDDPYIFSFHLTGDPLLDLMNVNFYIDRYDESGPLMTHFPIGVYDQNGGRLTCFENGKESHALHIAAHSNNYAQRLQFITVKTSQNDERGDQFEIGDLRPDADFNNHIIDVLNLPYPKEFVPNVWEALLLLYLAREIFTSNISDFFSKIVSANPEDGKKI